MKLIIFLLVVLFGTVNFYLNFWDYDYGENENFGEKKIDIETIGQNVDEKTIETMDMDQQQEGNTETIDKEQIEIAFNDLVECARKRFSEGNLLHRDQFVLKGIIFPNLGLTKIYNVARIQLDIVLVETIAGGEKLGETIVEVVSDPENFEDEFEKEVEEPFKEFFTKEEWDNLKKNEREEKKMFKVTIYFAKKHLSHSKNLVDVDWSRLCIIMQQQYVKLLAHLYRDPAKQPIETLVLFAKAFEWVKGVNAFHYDKLGENIDERNKTLRENEL